VVAEKTILGDGGSRNFIREFEERARDLIGKTRRRIYEEGAMILERAMGFVFRYLMRGSKQGRMA